MDACPSRASDNLRNKLAECLSSQQYVTSHKDAP